MARLIIVCLLAIVVVAGNETASAQTSTKDQPRLFQPLLKSFRERAAKGVLAEAKKAACAKCALTGKLCKKCAKARKARAEGKEAEEAIQKRFEDAELKKLEAEAKKAELDAKLAEEQDAERNKEWEVEDPENLESPSDLLKLAAESKQDANLAGKKQQALEFLAKLGCNKDPRVEVAILAGLKDHDANVRLAAIQAVLVAARGPAPQIYDPYQQPIFDQNGQPMPGIGGEFGGGGGDMAGGGGMDSSGEQANQGFVSTAAPAPEMGACTACRGKRQRKKIFTGNCNRCRGGGCDSCNYCGQTTQVYTEPCTVCQPAESCVQCQASHDRCKTCCPSKAILAELKKIAFEPDPQRENCNYEPSLDVRNLALEALNVCPEIKEPIKKGGKKGLQETPGDDEGPSGTIEQAGDDNVKLNTPDTAEITIVPPSPVDDELPKKDDDETELDDSIEKLDDDTTIRSRNSTFQSVGYRSDNRMLGAKIEKFYPNDAYLVKFNDNYIIPVGKSLYIENDGGDNQVVEVIQSESGLAKVQPLNGSLYYQEGTRLRVGIIE